MTPNIFTKYAGQLYPKRYWFLFAAVVGIALFVTPIFLSQPSLHIVSGLVAAPLMVVSWGLLLMCVWFNPEHGRLYPKKGLLFHLPAALQSFIRWYAAIFLTIFMVAGSIGFPIMAVLR